MHLGTRAFKAIEGHSGTQGTRRATSALRHLGHSEGTWALKLLGQLRHSGTRRGLGHSRSQELEALYLANSATTSFIVVISHGKSV